MAESIGLTRPTLVLNRSWQPVGVASAARSITLAAADRARIVDPADFQQYTWEAWTRRKPEEGDLFIQGVSFRIGVPEVVVLMHYDRLPRTEVPFSRRNIFQRDHWTCQYCGAQPGGKELTIDHVLPRSRGGKSAWDNCVLACVECNKRKADRTPDEARMPLRKAPVRPKWRPMYEGRAVRIASWSSFLSEAYWNVELEP